MLTILWIASLTLIARIGYNWREIKEQVKKIEQGLEELKNRKIITKKEDEQKSFLVDLDDIEVRARLEQEELMRKLNGEDYEN